MKPRFITNVIILKIIQFKDRDINIDATQLKKFMHEVYFKNLEYNEANLLKFLEEDNIQIIIDYLMNDSIINPEIDEEWKK